jgi:beta-glucosidase
MLPKLNYTDAARWADEILSQMTLAEKCAYVGGVDVFFIKGLPRLGLPPVLLSDATAGVVLRERFFDVTYQNAVHQSVAFPAPLMLAATWNPELSRAYATAIGEECNANGIGVLLGPGFNLYRVSQCGRNFEYFGEDPCLIARMVEAYVAGVQSTGTISTLKHFLANNTDYFRRKSNSIVDERTLHEIYLPGFKAGIEAGAMAVMTAYNLVNGEWAGQSEYVIKTLLRQTLGFQWLVMTDWWSVYDGAKVARSGQDLEMPASLATLDLEDKIQRGEVAEADVDRMVKSILTTLKAADLFEKKPQPDLIHKYPEHEKVALQTAREGTVLLRNENGILPLDKSTGDILLLGSYVHKKAVGGGSSEVRGYNQITLYQALHKVFGDGIRYEASPTDETIRSAAHIILSIGTQDAESWDRPFALELGEELYVKRILRLNPNVIVVVNAGSGIRMTDWYQQAAAIVYCFYNGQNGNIALAEILTGDVNPSGKLPFTIEREFRDGPGADYVPQGEALYYGANDEWEKVRPVYDVVYKEGVFVGYRWYDARNIEPLYPFGFGLSYTQFQYSDLALTTLQEEGGEVVEVRFAVTNNGSVDGQETVQVYVRDLQSSEPRPPKELKGFKKIHLLSGAREQIVIRLRRDAFTFWSSSKKDWVLEAGEFEIQVGSSSRDIRLSGLVSLQGDLTHA